MATRYRLVVIGGGPGGLIAVDFARRLGVTVALVERGRIGGDCTWTGCVPSKSLLHAASVAQTVRRAAEVGIRVPEPEVDFAGVMASVRGAIERVYTLEKPEVLRARGVDVIQGEARFVDPSALDVDGRRVEADRFLIATGARPVIPEISGLDEVGFHISESIFDLTTLPRRLAVLGAGPVGCEVAQAFQRLGSRVTLIDHGDQPLLMADSEASCLLADALAGEGVRLMLRSRVSSVRQVAGGIQLETERETVTADALLVAVGRRAEVASLELDRAGVEHSADGVAVNDYLRTFQPRIYACGDVTGSYQFTHYTGWQASLAVRNALLPGRSRARLETVPWTVFTDPEVAQVGLTENQARGRLGDSVRVTRWPIERVDRAVTDGESSGFLKLVHRTDGTLLGATVVSPRAGEVIQELSLALARHLRLDDLAGAIHVYPTYGIAVQQAAAEALYDRLTSGISGVVVRLLAGHWPRP